LSALSGRSDLIGIACAIGAWFMFSLNDVGIKLLSGDYPLHQIVWVRAFVGIIITLTILLPLEGGYRQLNSPFFKVHLVRGLCVGVIVMLRPGTSAFRFALLLPLLSALAYATLQVLTRKIGLLEKASVMAFYIQFVFVIVCTLFGIVFGDGRYANPSNPSIDFLFRAWTVPTAMDAAIMLGLGISSGVGGYLVSQAYRICEAALIAPFEYLALVLAIIWGISIWGEWPDLVAWVGIVMIFSSGLFVFWREVMLDKKFVVRHPMPRNR